MKGCQVYGLAVEGDLVQDGFRVWVAENGVMEGVVVFSGYKRYQESSGNAVEVDDCLLVVRRCGWLVRVSGCIVGGLGSPVIVSLSIHSISEEES